MDAGGNEDGEVNYEEFKPFFMTVVAMQQYSDAKALFDAIDGKDGDGSLTTEEFVKYLKAQECKPNVYFFATMFGRHN